MSKKAPAPSVGILKVVWFEDSKGYMRGLNSDTPTRYGLECRQGWRWSKEAIRLKGDAP